MWPLTTAEILQLKGQAERFVHLVDRLIRAEALAGGLKQSEIAAQLRVHIKDGGVDTEVRAPIPHDVAGWFGAPTVWQYKSTLQDGVNDKKGAPKKKPKRRSGTKRKPNDLETEISKPYVAQKVREGFAYRFCIVGDLTPEKRSDWEAQLLDYARRITPDALPPRVVDGENVRAWAERFPAIAAWLRNIHDHGMHWDAWCKNARSITPAYVRVRPWSPVVDAILKHVDFSRTAAAPCLHIGGSAGVGKSRLVCETLSLLDEAPSLVVYAPEPEDAKKIAVSVVNASASRLVIVADECPLNERFSIEQHARGHADRVRVITIDNAQERVATEAGAIWLHPDENKQVGEILAENFPEVPVHRRRQYERLAEGFIRLAADMCRFDHSMAAGDLSLTHRPVCEYVRVRLDANERRLASLVALFDRLGFRDDVRNELETLCEIVGETSHTFRQVIAGLHDAPGFVVRAGRFWYVSPEIVARVLFQEGWRAWVEDDVGGFLAKLPRHLMTQLSDRAATHGSDASRSQLARFFGDWFGRLTVEGLSEPDVMDTAAAIIESRPADFLPRLRTILEAAPGYSLLQIKGDAQARRWGPRRTLVWLLERLVSFPEYFADCEACLFRLGVYESEPRIGNNARSQWLGLFKVYLSGTATPFNVRIGIVRRRIVDGTDEELCLVYQGLRRVFAHPLGKVVGPPTAAGRSRPADWRPAGGAEVRACYESSLKLIVDGTRLVPDYAFDALRGSVFFLLQKGMAVELAEQLSTVSLDADKRRRLVIEIEGFLRNQTITGSAEATEAAREYHATVAEWCESLRPVEFGDRMRLVVSRDPWEQYEDVEARMMKSDLIRVAQEVADSPEVLNPHIEWCGSDEAASAEVFGREVGRRANSTNVGVLVMRQAVLTGAGALARGYVQGVLDVGSNLGEDVVAALNALERERPEIAAEVFAVAGDAVDGFRRLTLLVQLGRVRPYVLANLSCGIGGRLLTIRESVQVLRTLVEAGAQAGEALNAAIRFSSLLLKMRGNSELAEAALQSPEVVQCLWEVAERSAVNLEGRRNVHEWAELVGVLAGCDPPRVCVLASRALMQPGYSVEETVMRILCESAASHPVEAMAAFGDALMDEEDGWRLQVSVHRELISALPVEVVVAWAEKHGIEGMRRLARHLPVPHLDEGECAVVPVALDVILRRANDELTYAAFCSGVHSGEFWSGNASERFRQEAVRARLFLEHENEWIRRWAQGEVADRLHMAEWEDQLHAERFVK